MAVEALRDLRSHSKEGTETSNANETASAATKVATAPPSSVPDDAPQTVSTEDKVTTKQVDGHTGSLTVLWKYKFFTVDVNVIKNISSVIV